MCKPTASPGPTHYHANTKIARALALSGVEICTGVEAEGTVSLIFPRSVPRCSVPLSNKEAGPLPSLVYVHTSAGLADFGTWRALTG